MDAELENALQTQFNVERQNAEEYLGRAHALDALVWPGSAHFMQKAAGEEREHAEKFAQYLIARNIMPIHASLNAIPTLNGSLPTFFAEIYDLEVRTTDKINRLYQMAEDAGDPQTCVFLHWFVDEQTKSVKDTFDMKQETMRAAGDIAALLALDEKYAEL